MGLNAYLGCKQIKIKWVWLTLRVASRRRIYLVSEPDSRCAEGESGSETSVYQDFCRALAKMEHHVSGVIRALLAVASAMFTRWAGALKLGAFVFL